MKDSFITQYAKWYLQQLQNFSYTIFCYILYFKTGSRSTHPLLKNFLNFADFEKFVNKTMDNELQSKIRIVKTYMSRIPSLVKLIRTKAINDTDLAGSVLIISFCRRKSIVLIVIWYGIRILKYYFPFQRYFINFWSITVIVSENTFRNLSLFFMSIYCDYPITNGWLL